MTNQLHKPIIFFDGVCGLCNKTVDFIISKDKNREFLYTSLQGQTAKNLSIQKQNSALQSIILKDGENIYFRSTAVLKILEKLGGLWKTILVLQLIPEFFRDYVYNWIAKNRYEWFGKKDTCRLPTPEEKNYFLP